MGSRRRALSRARNSSWSTSMPPELALELPEGSQRLAQTRRDLSYAQAILEALDLCLARDPSVYLMGLGVPDPKGIFSTTLGLQQKYGPRRVLDIPLSENAMTGVAIGSPRARTRALP